MNITAPAATALKALPGFATTGSGQWQARCPAHDDRIASLSIATAADGKILIDCKAGCDTQAVLEAIGLSMKDLFPNSNGNGHSPGMNIVAAYDYQNAAGELVYQVVRLEPKDFRQRRPDGKGGWLWNTKGLERLPYNLAELQDATDIFICEGEKDCESLRKIGLTATCVAKGAESPDWPKVARYFRADHRITIIPDNDAPGESYARNAAQALAGTVASVRILRIQGLPAKGDVSDWLAGRDPEAAAEELCRLADGAPEWGVGAEPDSEPEAEPETSSRFRPANEIMAEARPAEIISGIAWADCLTTFTSESGTGKTFTLLSMAAAISDGNHWLARPVSSGSVAYVSYEGDALGVRLRALREFQGRTLQHVYVLRASYPLSPVIDRDKLETPSPGECALRAGLAVLRDSLAASGMPPVKLVVIDTIRASLSGSEDSSEAVSAYLRAVRRIASSVPGAAVILAHHSGWQDGDAKRKRERGSSAFRGNIDGTVYLELDRYDEEKHEGQLILRTYKVRDDEVPPPMYLIRKRVTLTATAEEAATGRPVTSCVIERDCSTPQDRQAAEAAEHRDLDLRVLRIIAKQPESATSQDRIRVAVGLKRNLIIEAIARLLGQRLILPPERQRQPYTVTPEGAAIIAEAK